MRRAGGLFEHVASFGALCDGARRAARGKRASRSAARFLERLEPEALALERELEAGTWRPGPVATFQIEDPKPRTITALPFRDQVVHHALIGVLEPVFERRMIADSYACRKAKGTHAALARAKHFVRRFDWFLKCDVRSFFDSVRHDVMLDALARVVKDRQVLHLCRTILRGPPGAADSGQGLPIGSLTSQWFANLLLDRLDHHVKEVLRAPGYLRYMDDFVLLDDARDRLAAHLHEVRRFLADPLHLALKEPATLLAPVSEGLPFLGWLLFRGPTRLRPANRRRYRWRLRHRAWEARTGRRSQASYVQAAGSLYELLRQGHTLGLRRRWAKEDRMDP